jgi:glycosyltransferase involved in cell wall biosynthesis
MATSPVLKNTCLCVPVRNELINPAGGIVDLIDSIVPYVEHAVILDTGSTDGTLDALEYARKKYRHLKIHKLPFRGFSYTKNYLLKQARKLSKNKSTKALFMDADERFSEKDIYKIGEFLEEYDPEICSFEFEHILPSGSRIFAPQQSERIFINSHDVRFNGEIYECLFLPDRWSMRAQGLPTIKHFLPTEKALDQKRLYYNMAKNDIKKVPHGLPIEEQSWRRYNPQRENHR